MLLRVLMILIAVCLPQYKTADESIFGFTGTNYKITLSRKECFNFKNSNMVLSCNTIERLNKTEINRPVVLTTKDITLKNLRIRIQAYGKNIYNIYNFKIASYEFSACTALKTNAFGFGKFVDGYSGNLTLCPIHPGTYYMSGKGQNHTSLPPNIPTGDYKVEYILLENKTRLGMIVDRVRVEKFYQYQKKNV